MTALHLAGLLPLLVFLILTLIFRKTGILHLITLAYSIILAIIAINGSWELLFFAPIAGTAIISLILFMACMAGGDWI